MSDTDTLEPTTLAGFVQHRMHELDIPSIRALARRSGVGHETVRRVHDGVMSTPAELTLQRLSEALNVPLTKLRELAGRPAGEREPFRLPAEFDQLDGEQRAVVLAVGRALLKASTGVTLSDEQPMGANALRLVGRARQPEE